ncbi:hypothetical protein AURDEDRAFT_180557 [Auricularia subglabra TFB-10046 SS5]|nr:hypothetical protein AURDEDRAFT_180557 [Auricularia subglabra TFB-10046 SS5]
MEFWPADTRLEDATTSSRRRKHHKSAQASHPVLSHGGLGAARLRESADDPAHLEWTTLSQVNEGPRLQLLRPSVKVFPATRSPTVVPTRLSTIARTYEAASLLRTYYPDAHVPFDLLREEISNDEAYMKDNTFDPFNGNRLATACICAEDARGRVPDAIDVLVFPTGELGEDLHATPLLKDPTTQVVKVVPHAVAQESFHNPILQISASSTSDPWFAVRTRDALTLANFNALVENSQPAPEVETRHFVRIDNVDLGKHPVLDVAMSPFAADLALTVNAAGDLYEVQPSYARTVQRFPVQTSDDNDTFKRVAWGLDRNTAFVASSKMVHWLDKRTPSPATPFKTWVNEIVTSIESPQASSNLMCFCTTAQVLWFDPRHTRHPVVGWKHGRVQDRTLEARTIARHLSTPLVCLSSRETRLLSLYDVDRPTPEGLVHAFGHPTPVLGDFADRQGLAFGRSLRDAGATSETPGLSVFELGPRNEIVRLDVGLPSSSQNELLGEDGVVWDEALQEMERDAHFMEPLAGSYAARKHINVDMTDLYQHLFVASQKRPSAQQMKLQGDAVHRVLHSMPVFWQTVDIPVENTLTLYDLAFRMGDEPPHPARADCLTGSALSTVPGRLMFARHGIPGPFMARRGGASWHWDMAPTLRALDPQFPALASTAEDVVPSESDNSSHMAAATKLTHDLQQQHALNSAPAAAQRRMREAVEDVVLDSALASYVYSVHPFSFGERDLPMGLSRLCIDSSALPPPVQLGHLRPRKTGVHAADEDTDAPDMPLGVRLLLSEWDVAVDPSKYMFRDPYGDQTGEEEDKVSLASVPQTQTQTQRTAPPVIVAASTLPARRREGSVPLPQSQPPMVGFSQSQGDVEMFTSTQVVPGPFGGRPQPAKKPPKKRVGGF